ncbi:MAG: bifunctional MFS transporter/dTMP kinase [Sciscionella sp.]
MWGTTMCGTLRGNEVGSISGGAESQAGRVSSAQSDASTGHRIRSVLAIRAFRRLWGVTYLCSVGDWLSLLAISGLAATLLDGYLAKSFAFSGVVLTQLLPGLIFAPIGGVLADRFDRRKIMVVCDVMRGGLCISIAVVGSAIWLFLANFLIGCMAMAWIPAKESSIPNLLRRKDQVETANQLGLVMTYGVSVTSGAGLYALISGIGPNLHVYTSELGIAYVAVIVNGLLYLSSALLVATRIPEISGPRGQARKQRKHDDGPGFFRMFYEGLRFTMSTPLVRGLVIGMIGAFAAGGAVIGTARQYASSLLGGESTFGMLFLTLFVGLASGMIFAPKLARRMTHSRLFGFAIVAAGLLLALAALSPQLAVSLVVVALVGACAGTAFLTGVTIIGSEVEDAWRGRVNAMYQSLLKVILAGSLIIVPLLVGLMRPRSVRIFNHPMIIDSTRPVLLGAGLLAAVFGVIAYRQMGDRSTESILSNLVAAVRRRPKRTSGLLLAVEWDTPSDTAAQAWLLTEWLRSQGSDVVFASDPALDESRLRNMLSGASLSGARAHALVAAAVRADMVERRVRPALEAGSLVVMERYVDSPFAHLGVLGGLDSSELEGLADWATDQLRPDVTVLLDRDPSTLPAGSGEREGEEQPTGAGLRGLGSFEHHWRVQRLLAEMAAADPDRYVVVNADGGEQEIAERVREAVAPLLAARLPAGAMASGVAPGGASPVEAS